MSEPRLHGLSTIIARRSIIIDLFEGLSAESDFSVTGAKSYPGTGEKMGKVGKGSTNVDDKEILRIT